VQKRLSISISVGKKKERDNGEKREKKWLVTAIGNEGTKDVGCRQDTGPILTGFEKGEKGPSKKGLKKPELPRENPSCELTAKRDIGKGDRGPTHQRKE